jgi:lipoprotein-releasing system permease protein
LKFFEQLPYEWQVGMRYLRAGRKIRRNGFLSFISAISIIGIALGVAVLIIVLSVINGFEKEVTNRMLSVVPDVEVFSVQGEIGDWQSVSKRALKNRAVLAAAPFVEFPGMFIKEDVMKPAVLRGIELRDESSVSKIVRDSRSSDFSLLASGSYNVVLGIELAKMLQVGVGDQIMLALASSDASSHDMMPQLHKLHVVGIFSAGHYQYDAGFAFMNIVDAEEILHIREPTGVRLKVEDVYRARQVADELKNSFGEEYLIQDWTQRNGNWFAAVQSQKKMIFIILTLIVAVAAFNVVAMLIMTVTDKRSDIAILRTLGASPRSIMGIFVVQGVLSGVAGIFSGVVVGMLVAQNLSTIIKFIEGIFGIHFLNRQIYFISELPSEIRAHDVFVVVMVASMLVLISTLYPSWRASRVAPAEALRYE